MTIKKAKVGIIKFSLMVLLSITTQIHADNNTQQLYDVLSEDKLIPQYDVDRNTFGYAIDISGTTAVISVPNELRRGFAHVYDFNGIKWVKSAVLKLDDEDYTYDDGFATSVSIDGDHVFIGANNREENNSATGAVYFYKRQNNGDWVYKEKILASDRADGDRFGSNIDINNGRALISARLDDEIVENTGSVYVFDYDPMTEKWSQSAKLFVTDANDAESLDGFGGALSLDGDTALIAAPSDNEQADGAGAVYVFKYTAGSWQQDTKIMASDAQDSDLFGWDVKLEGSVAVISAQNKNGGEGQVYIYKTAGEVWQESEILTPEFNQAQSSPRFGYAIGLNDGVLAVGSPGEFYPNPNTAIKSGSVSIYELNGSWNLKSKHFASDYARDDNFGWSLALFDDRLLVSAKDSDTLYGENAGKVFGFLPSQAGVWREKDILDNSQEFTDQNAGFSVDISGDWAVVGAPTNSSQGEHAGAVFLYLNSTEGWMWWTTLYPKEANEHEQFGYAVRIYGSVIAIGAPGKEKTAGEKVGAVYYFTRSGHYDWGFSDVLFANNPIEDDQFGCAVDIRYGQMVMTSCPDNNSGENSGTLYFFGVESGSYKQTQEFISSSGDAFDQFGKSLSLSQSKLLVGAPTDSSMATEAGAAYIFEHDGNSWAETHKLVANDSTADAQFGLSVSLDNTNNRAVIGSSYDQSGAAYVFDLNTTHDIWEPSQKLVADDIDNNDAFGAAVSLQDNKILIGSPQDDDNDENAGAVYTFNYANDKWYETSKIITTDGLLNDNFGYSVALDGENALSGAPLHTTFDENSGAAYIHNLIETVITSHDSYNVLEDAALPTVFDVLSNDINLTEDPLTVVDVGSTVNSSISHNSSSVTYQPNSNYCNDGNPTDDFTYTVNASELGYVSVNVICINDQPDFSHLGNQTGVLANTYTVPNWAHDFNFGPDDENNSQSVQNFNLQITSDDDSIIASIDVTNDGTLTYSTTGRDGSAVIEINMQDSGGTANGGINTSDNKTLHISITGDTIFSDGFE